MTSKINFNKIDFIQTKQRKKTLNTERNLAYINS